MNKLKLAAIVLVLLLLAGCGQKTPEATLPTEPETLGAVAGNPLFAQVPKVDMNILQYGKTVDYGGGTYILDINGATKSDYLAYTEKLERNGFQKFSDNGENGLEDYVYTASFTQDKLTLTVTYVRKLEKLYLAACQGLPLSPRMLPQQEDSSGDYPVSLHMVELIEAGNSFAIQLKNGHFLMIDGGPKAHFTDLVEYLESLVPEGEKPVIDGWFITHIHEDHTGALQACLSKEDYAQRLIVEEIFFNQPSELTCETVNSDVLSSLRYVSMAARCLHNARGENPTVYRPQMGQRYYYCGATVDIVMTQEQLTLNCYQSDLNESSTWLMVTSDGQTFLNGGDADYGSMDVVMRSYDPQYLNVDILTAFHHGINVFDTFTDYCTYKTLLYPCFVSASALTGGYAREAENARLREKAEEVMCYGDGTKILTFPYTVGSAKSLPSIYSENAKLRAERAQETN